MNTRALFLIVLAAFGGALGGVIVGRQLSTPPEAGAELHQLLHRELELDARQEAQIEVLERQFVVKMKGLQFEMRADNARLPSVAIPIR